jgi:hypothetical protein
MALERLPEEKFAEIMGRVLSPSRAIETPELLKGRDDQLREIRRAWYQGGRQIFIYGYRGVGKTSLAPNGGASASVLRRSTHPSHMRGGHDF